MTQDTATAGSYSANLVVAPYGLRRRFWRRIFPALLILLVATGAATIYAATMTADRIYLEFAGRNAEELSRILMNDAPDDWTRILEKGESPANIDAFISVMDEEMKTRHFEGLKLYGIAGQVYYSSNADDYATRELNKAIRVVLLEDRPYLLSEPAPDGTLYEIYVPVRNKAGEVAAVFEFYDITGRLDGARWRAASLAAIAPAGGLLLVIIALAILVERGQREINGQSAALVSTRRKLETLMSKAAIEAAERSGDIPSERQRLTIFFSDACDFTGYSERNPPERVVWFLNELIEIHLNAFNRHGGDIDKMIGDAILARFSGPDAEKRALTAAREIQEDMLRASLPREVGIGIYTGDVVSGAVGAPDRRDFTVIGDGVNVAARLCSAATGGEIVTDSATYSSAGRKVAKGFGKVEKISVKGRKTQVSIRRRPRSAAAADAESQRFDRVKPD